MEVKTRALQVRDIFTVGKILGKLSKTVRLQLATVLSDAKNKDANYAEVGIIVIQSLFIEAEADIKAWLADMAGVKVAEFDNLPAMVLLDEVNQILHQPDVKDFFVKASQLLGQVPAIKSKNLT